jgi:hypothetical protein
MLAQLVASVAMGCLVYMPNLCMKDGVRINGAHFDPVMVRIINVARETAPMMEKGTVWITSANDGLHMDTSLHYTDRAFDIRVKNIIGVADFPEAGRVWAQKMQHALGEDYDVLFERDHIHVEYDPQPNPHSIPDGFNLRIK